MTGGQTARPSTSAPLIPVGRLVSVDILRGLAILWVVLFHLWGDIEFFPPPPRAYQGYLVDEVQGGEPWAIVTATTDVLFRDGYQGVPLFMMLSGLALTIAAYRGGGRINWPRFYLARFRRLLIPYWTGFAVGVGSMAAIAGVQLWLHGGDFLDRLTRGVTVSVLARVDLDWGQTFAALALFPRLIRQEWFFAPEGALWFVVLIVQYYLLFPLLYRALRWVGPVPLLAAALAITLASNAYVIDAYGALEFQFRFVVGLAPFRVFEFVLGMVVGHVLVTARPDGPMRLLRTPAGVAGLLVTGFALHTAGDFFDSRYHFYQMLSDPLIIAGLTLLAVPLLVKKPGALEANLLARLIAFIGVMSYAVLIVNEPFRWVASQLRIEHVPQAWWWFFLTAIYVPLTVLLAWPLAVVLGLMPTRRVRRAPAAEPARLPLPAAEPVRVDG